MLSREALAVSFQGLRRMLLEKYEGFVSHFTVALG